MMLGMRVRNETPRTRDDSQSTTKIGEPDIGNVKSIHQYSALGGLDESEKRERQGTLS